MSRARIAIVGAGPVGLFQALCLHEAGFEVVVLERRVQTHTDSRSIGIHPPSLEALHALGLARPIVDAGVRVRRGRAFGRRAGRRLGSVDFGRCGGRFPYVLSLPQHRTEAVLREAVERRCPGSLRRGVEVRGLRVDGRGVDVDTDAGDVRAHWMVACDGRHSRMRALCGIEFEVARYEGEYAMADVVDHTPFGQDAAVFLTDEGLVECFPLPGGMRRWVARTDGRALHNVLAERTGYTLAGAARPNVFRAERGLAQRLVQGRVVLSGDAAHVVSPIGGQGMNLGWLGAKRITQALQQAFQTGGPVLERDARTRARMARAAARRSELNMWLGRPTDRPRLRERLVGGLLERPWVDVLARGFTMRGLRWGV